MMKSKVKAHATYIKAPSTAPSLSANMEEEQNENLNLDVVPSEDGPMKRGMTRGTDCLLMFVKTVASIYCSEGNQMSGTGTSDPLALTELELQTMKWWPGILAIVTSFVIPSLINTLFFIIFDWREYAKNPSRWWQCGVFCAALWLGFVQAFAYHLLQIKVRSIKDYESFTIPAKKAFVIYAVSALISFVVWTICWAAYGKVIPFWSTSFISSTGIISTAVYYTKFNVPENIECVKNIFWLLLLGPTMGSIALGFSMIYLTIFIISRGFTPLFVLYPMIGSGINALTRKLITFTKCNFLEPVLVFIFSMFINIFFIHSISWKGPPSYDGVIAAGLMNTWLTIYYYLSITAPMEYQMLGWQDKITALSACCCCTYNYDFPAMTSDERILAAGARSQLVYLMNLDMASKIIIPWWLPLQLALILFHTPANTSINTLGFSYTMESFTHRFNIALMLNAVDIVNYATITILIRRKYPLYDPFRVLHSIFEKFGFLPASGIMFVLMSIMCMLIAECKIF